MDMSTGIVGGTPVRAPHEVHPDLGYAEAAVLAVRREMEADARVVVLGEDVGRGGIFGQYKGLQESFGTDRVIDTPISESGFSGLGVGAAMVGLRPIIEFVAVVTTGIASTRERSCV